MNIALSGYGKMGRLIEKMAVKRGHTITTIIDPYSPSTHNKELSKDTLAGADVVIDFSIPSAAVGNIRKIAEAGKNIVVGTTGWYEEMETVQKITESSGIGLIWSGNFSTGVNLFFKIAQYASSLFNLFTEYDPFIHEYHHNQKADSPSGTASMLGTIVLKEMERKKRIITESLKRKIEPEELHITSTRGGSIPGTHILSFDSPVDTIELKHTARGREGFASGAVAAAQWIADKKGLFSIDDMMKDILKGV